METNTDPVVKYAVLMKESYLKMSSGEGKKFENWCFSKRIDGNVAKHDRKKTIRLPEIAEKEQNST